MNPHTRPLSAALRRDIPNHIIRHRELATTGTVHTFPTSAETEARLAAIHPATARAWSATLGMTIGEMR